MIWAAMSCYSAGPVTTLNGRITASKNVNILGRHLHPVAQMLFPNKDAIFKDDNPPTHTHTHTHTQPEVFSPGLRDKKLHLNIISGQHDRLIYVNTTKPLWSVLESRARSKFPPPSPLKQLADVLHEKWHNFPLHTIQNMI